MCSNRLSSDMIIATSSIIHQLSNVYMNSGNDIGSAVMEAGLDVITASDIVQQAAANYETSVTYPKNNFSNRPRLAAQVITSSLKPVVVCL